MVRRGLNRVLRLGRSPRILVHAVSLLRLLRRLPSATDATPPEVDSIFVSLGHHGVGDAVLSLILLERIHHCWPQAQIDVAVGSAMAPVLAALPYVRRTFGMKRSRFWGTPMAEYGELAQATALFRDQVGATRYDLAITPRWDSQDSFLSAYLAYLTGAPVRCGYSGRSDGGPASVDRFYTIAAVGGSGEPESMHYARLLARCGFEGADTVDDRTYELPIADLQQIVAARRAAGTAMVLPGPQPYAVLSPGSTKPGSIWPLERFIEVGRRLHALARVNVVVVGGPQERQLCEDLAAAVGDSAISTAGKTDILAMIDCIAGGMLFVGNDSGPGHVAGALGIGTIIVNPHSIHASRADKNSPARWRPVGGKVKTIQPLAGIDLCGDMCGQHSPHCILQVTVDEVWVSVKAALADLQTVNA